MGRFCQGVSKGPNGKVKIIEGTGTCHTTSNSYGKLSIRARNLKTDKLWATEKTPQTPGNMEQIILE